MLSAALPIGVAVSLALFEVTGLSAGGIVTPAYVALILDDPLALGLLAVASLLTWGAVELLARWLFLFGARRFSLAVLFGVAFSAVIYGIRLQSGAAVAEWAAFGFVIPGLIANQAARQGALPTLLMIAIAAPVVRVLALVIPVG